MPHVFLEVTANLVLHFKQSIAGRILERFHTGGLVSRNLLPRLFDHGPGLLFRLGTNGIGF